MPTTFTNFQVFLNNSGALLYLWTDANDFILAGPAEDEVLIIQGAQTWSNITKN